MVKKSVEKGSPESSKSESLFVLIALIVLNIIFVVEFLIGTVCVLIAFILVAFVLMVAGVVGFIGSLIYYLVVNCWLAEYVSLAGIHPVAIALLSLAIFCFGGLWMIGTSYLIKYFVIAMKWYFDLNVRVFRKYGP